MFPLGTLMETICLTNWDGKKKYGKLLKKGICTVSTDLFTPPKSKIDTQNDGFKNVSPFKYGYFGYPCSFSGV